MIEIISIGDELLNGSTLNTNAKYLAAEIFNMGYHVAHMTTYPDDEEILTAGIEKALSRSKVVITTGGLGPTLDDKTEEIVTKLFPSGMKKLDNSIGSAYGLLFEDKGLIVLPGVPREMEAMWQDVKTYVEKRLAGETPIHHKKITFCLLPELAVDPTLRELKKKYPEIDFGIYPSYGTLIVRMSALKPDVLDLAASELAEKFSTNVMDVNACKAEEALHKLLIDEKKTLSFAESCTGGNLASRMTALPDASMYFLGGVVSYSNAAKQQILGVSEKALKSHGAVSKETAQEMIEGVFEKFGSDYAISVTGVAGPAGGTKDKPVGTVWAAIGEKGKNAHLGLVPIVKSKHSREAIIQITSTFVLSSLWRLIKHGIVPFEEDHD